MTKTSVKIEIPDSMPDVLTKIGEDLLKKHLELGEASPLSGLDMETFAEKLNYGITRLEGAKILREHAEILNQRACLSIGIDKSQNAKTPGTVYSTLMRARDILMGMNRSQEQNLSEWGFDVVVSKAV
jgi:hypothetical protein